MADPDPEITLANAAAGPSEVRVGTELVRQQPLPDLIAVASRAANQKIRNPWNALKSVQIVPPGAG